MPFARSLRRSTVLALAAATVGALRGSPAAAASSRWASAVSAVSSQFSTTAWSAAQVLGPPDTWPGYGDAPAAWASTGADDKREYLELSFDAPEPINFVAVFESFHPGAIDSVYVRDHADGSLHLVYSATPVILPAVATVLRSTFPTTTYLVDGVRLTLASDFVPGWNEIDAVSLDVDSLLVPLPTASAPPPAPSAASVLERARPDPFRSSTELSFTLGRSGMARLTVYDVRGARVRTLLAVPLGLGRHSVRWDGEDEGGRGAPPGLYFMRLEAAGHRSSRRVVRVK